MNQFAKNVSALIALAIVAAPAAHAFDATGTINDAQRPYAAGLSGALVVGGVGTTLMVAFPAVGALALAGNISVGVAAIGGVTAFTGLGEARFKEMLLKQIQDDAAICLASDCVEPTAFLAPIIERTRESVSEQFGPEVAAELSNLGIAEALINATIQ